MRIGDGGDAVVRSARIVGTVAIGSRGLELRAVVRASLELACDRCLKRAPVDVEDDVELVLAEEPYSEESGEIEIETEDTEVYPIRDDRLDLDELTREQVDLLLPHKFLCDPQCRGLCPECGIDRNEHACDCSVTSVDPRFEALQRWKDQRT